MNDARGLIAGGLKELMCEGIEEQFGKDRKEIDRIARKAIEAEGKVDNDKGANLAVCLLLSGSWVHTDNIEEYEAFEGLKGRTLGGQPKRSIVLV